MRTFRLNKLLVPVNFTKSSLNALDTAITICQLLHGEITVLQVIDNTGVVIPPRRERIGLPLAEMSRVAEENLSALSKSLSGKYGISVKYAVDSGVAANRICAFAEEQGFDLIVMGTSVAKGMRKCLVGSTAYRVVKNARPPVLSVPANGLHVKFNKIMMPIRNAPRMLEKYDVVRPLALTSNASIVFAAVANVNDAHGFRRITVNLDSLRWKAKQDHVSVSSSMNFCDSISGQVLELSKAENPDMIVITSMVMPSLKRFFLDHYTKNIICNAPCPVLSIRSDL